MSSDTAERSLIVELSGRLHRARWWMRLAAVALLARGAWRLVGLLELRDTAREAALDLPVIAQVPLALDSLLACLMAGWLWALIRAIGAAHDSGGTEAVGRGVARLRGFFISAGVAGALLLLQYTLYGVAALLFEPPQPVA